MTPSGTDNNSMPDQGATQRDPARTPMDTFRQRASADLGQRQQQKLRSAAELARNQWERFWDYPWWEKGLVIAFATLAPLGVAIAIVALVGYTTGEASSPDGPGQQAALSRPSQSAVVAVSPATPALTPTPQPTPQATQVEPVPTRKPPANRADCREIGGTAYLSSAEREWFLSNCLEAVEAPVLPQPDVYPDTGPQPNGPSEPPPAPPTSPPPSATPSTGLSSGQAIALAVGWMNAQTGGAYTISAESCNASRMGARWVVLCQASLQGCQGSGCQVVLSACVHEQPPSVAASDSC